MINATPLTRLFVFVAKEHKTNDNKTVSGFSKKQTKKNTQNKIYFCV